MVSAGLVIWRRSPGGPQLLLAHPGGPFWARRDMGAWTIPKGVIEPGEEALAAALRETREELGLDLPGPFTALTPIRQKSGKQVVAFAVEADPEVSGFHSHLVEMEHPRGSGRVIRFEEIDRVEWFALDAALVKILPAQAPLLVEAVSLPGVSPAPEP